MEEPRSCRFRDLTRSFIKRTQLTSEIKMRSNTTQSQLTETIMAGGNHFNLLIAQTSYLKRNLVGTLDMCWKAPKKVVEWGLYWKNKQKTRSKCRACSLAAEENIDPISKLNHKQEIWGALIEAICLLQLKSPHRSRCRNRNLNSWLRLRLSRITFHHLELIYHLDKGQASSVKKAYHLICHHCFLDPLSLLSQLYLRQQRNNQLMIRMKLIYRRRINKLRDL